ncbi:uncharacterized protein LOC123688603 [Harmonia axyridis]|uniref:uncharacterized protein LOC123688603 n=1 Tax=Harmonia axyridis TaxID=115357 RepID=UPI001E2756A7|nr:uncharacterized protein LOC123688603 [Harmonia axyridis]XP_045483150.1 uncharacterized protein LOC123688603 [Harmonia axyridis]
MALSWMIIFIVVVFTLFSYFMWCYGCEEEKRRNRFENRYPRQSFESNICAAPVNPTRHRNQNPTNIGFNVTTDAPRRIIPPVGAVPSAPNEYPTPYPPQNVTPYPPLLTPYPIVESDNFPSPAQNLSKPTAPVQDDSQPPSYYEATKNNMPKY